MRNLQKILFALLICFPLFANSEDTSYKHEESTRARMKTETNDTAFFHKMIDQASEVYKAIIKGPHGEVPITILKNTRCIAVLPNVVTGALLLGGTRGEGLASCRTANNNWSPPVAISLNQGSIGVQVGAKSTDVVIFFQSKVAEDALKTGDFVFGTNVSAVAGDYNAKLETANEGVIVFTRTEGLFAGASVNGSKLSYNAEILKNYYGEKVGYTSLLEGREKVNNSDYPKKLTNLFP